MSDHPTIPAESGPSPMGQRFKEQLPTVVLTAALVIAAVALMYDRSAMREVAALAPLQEQNQALQAQADENRRQIEATAQLLRDAIGKHEGELFKSDVEIQKLNGERIDSLAAAIAQKVRGALPSSKTPEELARFEDEQVDKVSARTAEKLQPAIADLGRKQQDLVSATVASYNERVQSLNNHLQATQAAAQDALKLSDQVSALYLDSFKDHGVLVRLLALPADLVRDAATGNLVTGKDRKQAEQDINAKLQEIRNRLNQIQAQGVAAPLAAN